MGLEKEKQKEEEVRNYMQLERVRRGGISRAPAPDWLVGERPLAVDHGPVACVWSPC